MMIINPSFTGAHCTSFSLCCVPYPKCKPQLLWVTASETLSSLDIIFAHLVHQKVSVTAVLGSIRKSYQLLMYFWDAFYQFIFNKVVSKMTRKSTGIWPDSKPICMSNENVTFRKGKERVRHRLCG